MFIIKMKISIFLCLAVTVLADRFYYEGYKVYDLYPSTPEEVAHLHELMLTDPNLDFWLEPNRIGKATVMVAPEHQSSFIGSISSRSIAMNVRHEDLSEEMEDFWTSIDRAQAKRTPGTNEMVWNEYNTLATIDAWTLSLDGNCGREDDSLICEVDVIGTTVQNRDIYRVRVATSSEIKDPFWIDSTVHAREWITPATITNVLNYLVTSYGTDTDSTRMLDNYDWYFVLVANPDGYDYSWTDERMWRKNRVVNAGSSCIGVDLNRNFDYNWGREGMSNDPCSNVFAGPSPASELEIQALTTEIARVNSLTESGILVAMSFHSFGYMWMTPWGNTINFNGGTCERTDDHDEMYRLADVTANAIGAVTGRRWARGTSCEVIYATTGSANDWFYGALGIVHAIIPELRGNSFIVPAEQIQDSFEEVWAGLVAQEQNL